MTKYDDASWHYGGEYPAGLPNEAAGTHIGMFFAWCMLNGCASKEVADEVDFLRLRQLTPGAYLMQICDEKFVSYELNDEGNAFTNAYYESEEENKPCYVDDYLDVFATETELYRVEDTWDNYDRISERITARHKTWLNESRASTII